MARQWLFANYPYRRVVMCRNENSRRGYLSIPQLCRTLYHPDGHQGDWGSPVTGLCFDLTGLRQPGKRFDHRSPAWLCHLNDPAAALTPARLYANAFTEHLKTILTNNKGGAGLLPDPDFKNAIIPAATDRSDPFIIRTFQKRPALTRLRNERSPGTPEVVSARTPFVCRNSSRCTAAVMASLSNETFVAREQLTLDRPRALVTRVFDEPAIRRLS